MLSDGIANNTEQSPNALIRTLRRTLRMTAISRSLRLFVCVAAAFACALVTAHRAGDTSLFHATDMFGRRLFSKNPAANFCPSPCVPERRCHPSAPRCARCLSHGSWPLLYRSGKVRRANQLNKCKPLVSVNDTTICRGVGWTSVPGVDPVIFLDFYSGVPVESLRGYSNPAFNVLHIVTGGAVRVDGKELARGDAQWMSAGAQSLKCTLNWLCKTCGAW